MKAILIEIYQPEACYKCQNTYNIKTTYPLPPYSTVVGMIHNACDFDKYHEMLVGIKGSYSSTKQEINTAYYFGGHKYEEGRHSFKTSNGDIGVIKGLMNTQTLNEVRLKIYIVPQEKEFENVFESVYKPKKFLSLGRHEDIVIIEKVEIIELEEIENTDGIELKDYMYIPIDMLNDSFCGTIYPLHKKFSYNKKNIRVWETEIPSICSKYIPGSTGMYIDKKNGNYIVLV